jgi:3-hydroxybutyrate dehydrogenase
VNPAYVRTPLVSYLCRPESSFVTGGSFVMDGGWTAH